MVSISIDSKVLLRLFKSFFPLFPGSENVDMVREGCII